MPIHAICAILLGPFYANFMPLYAISYFFTLFFTVYNSNDSKELVGEVVENLLTSIVTINKKQVETCSITETKTETKTESKTETKTEETQKQKQTALFVPLQDVFQNTPLSSFSCTGCSKSYSIKDSFSLDLKCQTMLISCSQCSWWTRRKIATSSKSY